MPNNCSLDSAVDSTDQLSYMRQQCTPGYYGPLCALCLKQDSNDHAYGRTSTWSCQRCRHHGTTIVAYAVSFVLVLLFLDYTIRVTIRENSEAWESGSNDTGAAELIRVRCAVQYNTRLLIKLTPKGVIPSFLVSATAVAFHQQDGMAMLCNKLAKCADSLQRHWLATVMAYPCCSMKTAECTAFVLRVAWCV